MRWCSRACFGDDIVISGESEKQVEEVLEMVRFALGQGRNSHTRVCVCVNESERSANRKL